MIKITIYCWAGQKWFFRIRNACVQCDLAVAQIRGLLSAHPDWPVELEVKPWLNHLWESLRHGGWHAPVVLVDDRLVSQGTIPIYAELRQAVRAALAQRGIPSQAKKPREQKRTQASQPPAPKARSEAKGSGGESCAGAERGGRCCVS